MQTNENVSSQSPLRYFISRFLILIGMAILFNIVFMVIGFLCTKYLFGIKSISFLSEIDMNPESIKAAKFLQVFASIGTMVLPAFILTWLLQQDEKTFLKLNSIFSVKHFFIMISLLVFSIPFIAWLIYFNGKMHLPEMFSGIEQKIKEAENTAEQMTKALIKTSTPAGFALNLFVVALVPAFCEELFFRGALQQLIKICFEKRHLAVWLSAILFSAIHMEFFGFLPRLVLGVFLGYLFEYSGSLWLNVLFHFINNALALTSNYFKWNESAVEYLKDDYVFPVYVNIASFLVCIAVIYFLHLTRKKISTNGE